MSKPFRPPTPTRLAVRAAGGPSVLARALGLSASAVMHWQRVPARHLPRVSELSGWDKRDLRPDLFMFGGDRAERPEAA